MLVCDFGSTGSSRVLKDYLESLVMNRKLVIAAASNDGRKCWPAEYALVMAVGALDKGRKPAHDGMTQHVEIFAPESLAGSMLADWVEDPYAKGTSFAALTVAAAAALVWATYQALPGWEVRRILRETSTPLAGVGEKPPGVLNVEAALCEVQSLVVLDVLERGGKNSLTGLIAETGLPTVTAMSAIDRLLADNVIARHLGDDGDVYSYPGSNRIAI